MKTLKAFIKPSEAPERSLKIKILLNFYFNKTLHKTRRVINYLVEAKKGRKYDDQN